MLQLILSVIIGMILIAILVQCKRKVLPRCCGCFQKIVNLILNKLMFNSVLRALMQTYFANCIALWFSFTTTGFDGANSIVDFCLALLTLAFAVAFPIFCWKFLNRNKDDLRQPSFKAKFDSIYQNVDYYNVKALANTSLFLLRRFLFAAVIVMCGKSLVLQVFLADILSTCLIIYFILVKPYNDSWGNAIQIFNEFTVLTCVWTMFQFTAFVPDPELRYGLAYYFLYFVGVDVAINVLYLVYTLIKKIY